MKLMPDSPRVHEAKRRHALDEALWFLYNRAAEKAHKDTESEVLMLKRTHNGLDEDAKANGSRLSGDQIDRIISLLPLVMQTELRERL